MGDYNFGNATTPTSAWMEYGVNVALTAWKNASNNNGGPGRLHALSAFVDASPDFGNATTTFHIDLWPPSGASRFANSVDYGKGRGTGSWSTVAIAGGDQFQAQQDFLLGWYRGGADSIGFRTTGAGGTNLSDSNDLSLVSPYAASPYNGDPGVYGTIFLSDVYVLRGGGWNRMLIYPRRSGGWPATITYVRRGAGWSILGRYLAEGGELSRHGIRCRLSTGEDALLVERDKPSFFGSVDCTKLGFDWWKTGHVQMPDWGPDHPSCRSLRRASWEPDWLVDAKEGVRDLAERALKMGYTPSEVAEWQKVGYPGVSDPTKWVGPSLTKPLTLPNRTRRGGSFTFPGRTAAGARWSAESASGSSPLGKGCTSPSGRTSRSTTPSNAGCVTRTSPTALAAGSLRKFANTSASPHNRGQ